MVDEAGCEGGGSPWGCVTLTPKGGIMDGRILSADDILLACDCNICILPAYPQQTSYPGPIPILLDAWSCSQQRTVSTKRIRHSSSGIGYRQGRNKLAAEERMRYEVGDAQIYTHRAPMDEHVRRQSPCATCISSHCSTENYLQWIDSILEKSDAACLGH